MTGPRHSTSLYRDAVRPRGRPHKEPGNIAESDLKLYSPTYRGWRLACVGAQIPKLQRDIDAYWHRAYLEADSPAAKCAVLMEERHMRDEPKDWT